MKKHKLLLSAFCIIAIIGRWSWLSGHSQGNRRGEIENDGWVVGRADHYPLGYIQLPDDDNQ